MNKVIIILLVGFVWSNCSYDSERLDERLVGVKPNEKKEVIQYNIDSTLKVEYLEYMRSLGLVDFSTGKMMMNFYMSREGINYVPEAAFERLLGFSKEKIGKTNVYAKLFLKRDDFIFGTFKLIDSLSYQNIYTIYDVDSYRLVDQIIITKKLRKNGELFVTAREHFLGDSLIIMHIEPTSMETRDWIKKEPFLVQEFKLSKKGFLRLPL